MQAHFPMVLPSKHWREALAEFWTDWSPGGIRRLLAARDQLNVQSESGFLIPESREGARNKTLPRKPTREGGISKIFS